MKKLVNGKIIEMTPDEIAAWEQEVAQQPSTEPTAEERIAALEEEKKKKKISSVTVMQGLPKAF